MRELVNPSDNLVATEDGMQQALPQVARLEKVIGSTGDRVQQLREALRVDHEYLSEDQEKLLGDLVMEYQDIFSLDPLDLGSTNIISHSINTREHPPIKQTACRTPFVLGQKIEEFTKQMLEAGVIQPVLGTAQ